jgi:hypothetical protein
MRSALDSGRLRIRVAGSCGEWHQREWSTSSRWGCQFERRCTRSLCTPCEPSKNPIKRRGGTGSREQMVFCQTTRLRGCRQFTARCSDSFRCSNSWTNSLILKQTPSKNSTGFHGTASLRLFYRSVHAMHTTMGTRVAQMNDGSACQHSCRSLGSRAP